MAQEMKHMHILRQGDTFMFFEAEGFKRLLGKVLLKDMPYKFPEFAEIAEGDSQRVKIEQPRLVAHGIY